GITLLIEFDGERMLRPDLVEAFAVLGRSMATVESPIGISSVD
ncbi:hypothetical protein A2U01_0073100, partial [Trifolium medium]|nr:hypothetical protein [Trifolium medium]